MFERGVWERVPPSAIPVKRGAATTALASLWHQQSMFGPAGARIFSGLQVPAVNIRLFNTTGPGKTNDAPSDFVRQLIRIKKGLQPPVIEVGNLKPRRAFLDVNDTVRGFYLAAMKGKRGEAYNLCAPEPTRSVKCCERRSVCRE